MPKHRRFSAHVLVLEHSEIKESQVTVSGSVAGIFRFTPFKVL
jgi:hypothetical protein